MALENWGSFAGRTGHRFTQGGRILRSRGPWSLECTASTPEHSQTNYDHMAVGQNQWDPILG